LCASGTVMMMVVYFLLKLLAVTLLRSSSKCICDEIYRFSKRYGKFSGLVWFLLSFNWQNVSYVMAVNLLYIQNASYYIPALNSGLVHIWATFVTMQWRSDVWIYLQHRCMSVESIGVPGDFMYADFNWKLSVCGVKKLHIIQEK